MKRKRKGIMAALVLTAALYGVSRMSIYAADRLTIEVVEEIPASELTELGDEEVPLAAWPGAGTEEGAGSAAGYAVPALIGAAGGTLYYIRRRRVAQYRLRRQAYREEKE